MMIDEKYVNFLLQNVLPEEVFVVRLKISNAPKISIFIDSIKGVSIKECQIIHKKIASEIRKKTDDFLLDVSSPGITGFLTVWQQFFKLKGKKINLTTINGENFDCNIENADENQVKLILKNNEELILEYSNIKKAKPVIEF